MELLYIWIKDWKNIKQQGFNFSSEWHFHYESGNLNITRQKDYIPHFFGTSISNVTIIVGENGSGKSNLVEFIGTCFKMGIGSVNECIIVYRTNNELHVLSYEGLFDHTPAYFGFEIRIHFFKKPASDIILRSVSDIEEARIIYYSPIEDTFFSNFGMPFEEDNFKDISERGIKTKRDKQNNVIKDEYIPPSKYYFNNIKWQAEFYAEFGNAPLTFPVPNFLKIIINPDFGKERFIAFGNEKKLDPNSIKIIWDFFEEKESIYDFFRALFVSILVNIPDHSIQKQIHFFSDLIESFPDSLEKILIIEDCLNNHTGHWEDLHKMMMWLHKDCLPYWNQPFKRKEKYLLFPGREPKITQFFRRIDALGINVGHIFQLSWTYDKGERGSLSSGYNNLMNLFSRIYKVSQWIGGESFILLIDEGELGLHPELQKQYLSKLIENIPVILRSYHFGDFSKVQLILTTHSPFLVSDVPRENVIFLSKNDEGACEVVENKKDKDEKGQTFGANIHTLLSDSFFLKKENGLMGSFAKKRIDQVIKFYQEEVPIEQMSMDDSKIFAQKVVDLVGEPLIKRYLLLLQASKDNTRKDDIINALERENEALKLENESLKKQLNDD